MTPKLLLGLALVLGGGLVGCSTATRSTDTKLIESPDAVSLAASREAITDLGTGFSIRAAADSWPALVQKEHPAFAWNGCDLLWIEPGKHGQPQFILDEAYLYQPTNQPRQWVLLETGGRKIPEAERREAAPRFFYSGCNLGSVAKLQETVPHSDHGEDYAVAIAANRKIGTVYEIGWQREMCMGTGHYEYGRRIYLWRDRLNHWYFLGEGPEEGWGRGGGCTITSHVVWENIQTNNLPFQIQFHREAVTTPYHSSADDTNQPSDVTVYYDTALVAGPPALIQDIGKNPYLLAETNDTLEKIVYRLGYFHPGWDVWPDEAKQQAKKKQILDAWRAAIVRLNPDLPPQGPIKENTRINLVNPADLENQLIKTTVNWMR